MRALHWCTSKEWKLNGIHEDILRSTLPDQCNILLHSILRGGPFLFLALVDPRVFRKWVAASPNVGVARKGGGTDVVEVVSFLQEAYGRVKKSILSRSSFAHLALHGMRKCCSFTHLRGRVAQLAEQLTLNQ